MQKIYFELLDKDLEGLTKYPQPAILSRPSWWKDIPKKMDRGSDLPKEFGVGTIRSCPAVSDAIGFGYTMFLPTDVYIDNSDEENFEWLFVSNAIKEEFQYIEYQHVDQLKGYDRDNFSKNLLKINSLFGVKTDPGYSCWFTHPMHRLDLPFRILDAIVDTDKFPANKPYACLIKKNFKGIIPAGTPLVHVIPFKREDFSMEITDFNKVEMDKLAAAKSMFFSSGYKKLFWSRKKFE